MAFHLPNISHSSSSLVILQSTTKSPLREKLVTTTTTYQKLNHNNNNPSLKLEIPPQTVDAQPDKELSTSKLTSTDNSNNSNNNKQKKNDFYVNVGLAVRTLREDLPLLFSKDLNYDIYRFFFLWFSCLVILGFFFFNLVYLCQIGGNGVFNFVMNLGF